MTAILAYDIAIADVVRQTLLISVKCWFMLLLLHGRLKSKLH